MRTGEANYPKSVLQHWDAITDGDGSSAHRGPDPTGVQLSLFWHNIYLSYCKMMKFYLKYSIILIVSSSVYGVVYGRCYEENVYLKSPINPMSGLLPLPLPPFPSCCSSYCYCYLYVHLYFCFPIRSCFPSHHLSHPPLHLRNYSQSTPPYILDTALLSSL